MRTSVRRSAAGTEKGHDAVVGATSFYSLWVKCSKARFGLAVAGVADPEALE